MRSRRPNRSPRDPGSPRRAQSAARVATAAVLLAMLASWTGDADARKKKSEPVVQIGSLSDIKPIGAPPVQIASVSANGGNGKGNGSHAEKHTEAPVAGD